MVEIPVSIDDKERIIRTIFSPYHYDKKKNKIKPGAFSAPKGSNEVSVDRLDYTTIDICRSKARSMESEGKSYMGVAVSLAMDIRSVDGVRIESSPLEDNKCHADILYDFVVNKGEVCPPDKSHKIKLLADKFRMFLDSDTSSEKWMETELQPIK